MNTTRITTQILLMGLVAGLTACGVENESIALDRPEHQVISALTTGSADEWLDESISKRRFIGVKPSGFETRCPRAGGPFETYRLFSNDNRTTGAPFGWAMGNFCVYESTQDQDVSRNTDGTFNLPFELEALKCSSNANNATTNSANLQGCLRQVTPDRFAVGGHSSPNPKGMLATVMAPHFEEEFFVHTGHVAELPENPHPFNTRLAFLDTSRTEITPHISASYRRWNKRHSDHGLMMTRIGEKLACGDGNCMADVTSRLAMPYRVALSFERDSRGDFVRDSYGNKKTLKDSRGNDVYTLIRDENNGGHLGTISDLASAIHQELAEWNWAKVQHGHELQRLVLNMSLAWMPEYGGVLPSDFNDLTETSKEMERFQWPADVQAAFVALRDARCRGALLVAAAGNQSGGTSDTGLLLPAAWTEADAPSQTECDLHQSGSLSAGTDLLVGPQHYNSSKFPLVIAASGITRLGEGISNQRQGARVPLNTYADHATLQDFREQWSSYFSGSDNPLHIKPHTGTSVSSAVLATIAATAWSYNPDLNVNNLMRLVYDQGEAITDASGSKVKAEFCHGEGAACTVDATRITMCRTIYGIDADKDGLSDVSGLDVSDALETHCNTWADQIATTPDSYGIAMPAAATGVAASASDFETASVSQTHVYWPRSINEFECDAGSQDLYAWTKTTGSWKRASDLCPAEQFFTPAAAPWTVPQPEGSGTDCGGACALFPSFNMVALSSGTDLALVSSPTLTITTTAGTTSQFSLSGLSGTNTMLNFGGLSTMSIRTANFSGRTGSYSFSSPLYLGY